MHSLKQRKILLMLAFTLVIVVSILSACNCITIGVPKHIFVVGIEDNAFTKRREETTGYEITAIEFPFLV